MCGVKKHFYLKKSIKFVEGGQGKAHNILLQTLFVQIIPTIILWHICSRTTYNNNIYLSICFPIDRPRAATRNSWNTPARKSLFTKTSLYISNTYTRRVAQNIKEHRLYYNTRHSVSAHTSKKCNLTLVVSASMPCVHNCTVQRVSADAECLPIYPDMCGEKQSAVFVFKN